MKNGLIINLKGNEKILSDSNLLIDAKSKQETYEMNISLPEINNNSNSNIEIIKNINLENQLNFQDSFQLNGIILSKQNQISPILINKVTYEEDFNNSFGENLKLIRSMS